MKGFNRAIIAGNLTRDPDVRYTVNKKCYARFTVAINSRWKNANGELQESTEYINVVVWGPVAENCGKYLRKGSPVLLEGRLQTSSYEAKDGSGKKYSTEINADNVQFLSSGQQQNSNSNSGGNAQRSSMPDFGYVPTDEDFGKSIGESGFGNFTDDFQQSSGSSNAPKSFTDKLNEREIPF